MHVLKQWPCLGCRADADTVVGSTVLFSPQMSLYVRRKGKEEESKKPLM